jgi:hypothetical protein
MNIEIRVEEPTLEYPFSQLCTQSQIDSPAYARWCGVLREARAYHRKQWEICYILQALWKRGCLAPGRRGLGFGVGEEPLSAVMATFGCRILASDLPSRSAAAGAWIGTRQHASSLQVLNARRLCDPALFAERVSFAEADMNAVPAAWTGFDFTWSACALDHLGSIEHGLSFIERSLGCIRPGGVAVHTTEFNVSSDSSTIAAGSTVLFRRRDIVELAERLASHGHRMVLNFNPGSGEVDRHVDEPPYSDVHLKLRTADYVATSIGLIVGKSL